MAPTSTSASTSSPDEEARQWCTVGAAAFAPAQMAEITQIVRVVEEVLGSQVCFATPFTAVTPILLLPPELLPPPSLLLLP